LYVFITSPRIWGRHGTVGQEAYQLRDIDLIFRQSGGTRVLVPSIGNGATVVATVSAVEGIAPRNPMLLFVLAGVLFRFVAQTPLLRPLL